MGKVLQFSKEREMAGDIPIVGSGASLRNFPDWVKEKFEGSVQDAFIALIIGLPPVTEQDQRDFLPRIPPESLNMALGVALYRMVAPIYAEWVLSRQGQPNEGLATELTPPPPEAV